jgi:hypothetical protein
MQRIAERQDASLVRLSNCGARAVYSLPMVPLLNANAMLDQLSAALVSASGVAS